VVVWLSSYRLWSRQRS